MFSFQQIICCWISHILPSYGSGVCHFICFLLFKPVDNSCAPEGSLSPLPLPGLSPVPSPLQWCCLAEEVWVPRGLIHTALQSTWKVIAEYHNPKPLQHPAPLLLLLRAKDQSRNSSRSPPWQWQHNLRANWDFILLRQRICASLFSQPFILVLQLQRIVKELKKAPHAITQAEPLVNLHLASETCWVKLLGVDKSV